MGVVDGSHEGFGFGGGGSDHRRQAGGSAAYVGQEFVFRRRDDREKISEVEDCRDFIAREVRTVVEAAVAVEGVDYVEVAGTEGIFLFVDGYEAGDRIE